MLAFMSPLTNSTCSGGGSGDGDTDGGSDGEGDLDLLRDEDGKSNGGDGKSGGGDVEISFPGRQAKVGLVGRGRNEYHSMWCSSRKRCGTGCGHSAVTI
nr:hypothetical protein [Tanacetum cinerariifolium]